MTKNPSVLKWIEEMKALVKPDAVVWIDGSEEQLESLRAEAEKTGELHKLNEEKLPNCYLHHTDPKDVARVEQRTFICSRRKEDAGPTNNWWDPQEAYATLSKLFDGAMKGRTMYVIPYAMGLQGHPRREREVYLPLPGGQHHLVDQLRLRRQRPARQEVLRAAYRVLPG